MLTFSGVSSFCPHRHTTLSPVFPYPDSFAYFIASTNKLSVPKNDGIFKVIIPLVRFICLITLPLILNIFIFNTYHNAKIGCLGLYLATSLAVCPLSVITMIKDAFVSSAVLTAAEQTAS